MHSDMLFLLANRGYSRLYDLNLCPMPWPIAQPLFEPAHNLYSTLEFTCTEFQLGGVVSGGSGGTTHS